MYHTRQALGGITAAIVMLGLILALTINPFNLPIFFASIACAIIVGAVVSGRPSSLYGAIPGAMWMFILALYFVTHIWILFLIGVMLTALLGTVLRPLVASMSGMPRMNMHSQPTQPYYQPPQQAQPTNQSYQQGYQPAKPASGDPHVVYQEGGQQHTYPPQQSQEYENPDTLYNQPQAQYPQQMPPQ
jgi:hypothetical protein